MNNKSALIEFTVVVTPAGMGDIALVPLNPEKWLNQYVGGFEKLARLAGYETFHLLRWAAHGALIPGYALLDGSTLYASADFPKNAYKMVAMATISVTRCRPNQQLTRQERYSLGNLDKVADLW